MSDQHHYNPDGSYRCAELLWGVCALLAEDELFDNDIAFLQDAADNQQLHPDEKKAWDEMNSKGEIRE